ncbi:MAG: alpha/beta hydrolase [Saprospiraceae bacterium]|nr:alpha/beta hydrolase [Saprospiraceae bacterium]
MKTIVFGIALLCLLPLFGYTMQIGKDGMEIEKRTLQTDLGQWNYAISHEGTTAILFLHGANSSHKIWHQQFGLQVEGYKNIYVDLLGYGDSDKPKSGYSLKNWLEGLHGIIAQEEVKQVCIVAHSNGVIFAKEFYRSYPEQVQQLILLDGMLKQMISGPVLEWMKSTLERSDYKEFMANNIKRMPIQALEIRDQEILQQDALNTPKSVVVAEFNIVTAPETWEPLEINCPTIILHANSPYWTDDYVKWLHTVAPAHQFIHWTDAGHFIPLQYPERLNALIKESLSGNRK